jgi:predicted rRNA methylase YqxC with S4 and FtsJ domains
MRGGEVCLWRGQWREAGLALGMVTPHFDAQGPSRDSLTGLLDRQGFIREMRERLQSSQAYDLIVADLSFISQTLVLPAVVALLKPGGSLLTLVKPQFELQPGQVGKGGIVKDASLYLFVEQRLREACAALGLVVTAWFDSPIAGGDGNHEFFICARHLGLDTLSK